MPLRALGVWVAVVGFVFTQFVDVTLFTAGGLDVTVQKVAALIFFPLALGLMGQLVLSTPLLILGSVLIVANSAAYVVKSDLFDPMLLSANATVLTGLAGAIVLYTALTRSEVGFSALGRTWSFFAAVTSIIVLGQAAGLLPLWTVAGEALEARAAGVGGLYRGTGFKFDPNFQALVLAIGVVFTRFYVHKLKNAISLLILLGIVGTFSRMGLLVAILAWTAIPIFRAWASRTGRGVAPLKVIVTATIPAVALIGVYVLSPQEVRSFFDQRVDELAGAYSYLVAGAPGSSVGMNSAEERILLLRASLEVLSQNYLYGIGANKTIQFLYPIVGVDRVAHNTYLEELLIGGLLGALAIALYVAFVARALIRSHRARGDANRRSFTLALIFAFGMIGAFLTFNHNAILWLPLVVALADLRMAFSDGNGGLTSGS